MGYLRGTSAKGKIGGGIAALFALIAGILAFTASPAAAHHSNISATAACATGAGGWVVNWTASTWSSSVTEGGHPAILVEYRIGTSGPWSVVPQDSSAMPYKDVAKTPVEGVGIFLGSASPSFTGTLTFPPSASDRTVEVRSRPLSQVPSGGDIGGPWYWEDDFLPPGDGNASLDVRNPGDQLTWRNFNTSVDSRTTSVTLKGGKCQGPNPSWEIIEECATKDGETGITVRLKNTGDAKVTFDLNGTTHEVAAGGQKDVFIQVDEDDDYTVSVKVGGSHVGDSPYTDTRDCLTPLPAASVVHECATDRAGATGVLVELSNSGSQAITFEVEGVDGTFPVEPDGEVQVFVPVEEDAPYSITVTAGGAELTTLSGTRDCENPEPAVSLATECAVLDSVEGIAITLANTGGQAVTFTVQGIGDVVVGPNSSEVVFIEVAENSAYSVAVEALGGPLPGSPIAGVRDCRVPKPSVKLSSVCATDGDVEGIAITLENKGDDEATFLVDSTEHTVAAKSSKVVFIPVEENATYSVTVTSTGLSKVFSGTRDCRHPDPSVELTSTCAVLDEVEGIEITLTNDGDDEATFDVDGTEHTVPAKSTTSVFVPVEENTDYSITVTSGGQELETFTGTRDCRHGVGGAAIELECAVEEGVEGVLVKVSNTGTDVLTFVVGSEAPVDVAGGDDALVFVEVEEDTDYSILVTADGEEIATLVGSRDCRQGVAGIGLVETCAVEEGVEGIRITLTNSGDDDITITVVGVGDFDVAPGGEVPVFVPVAENTSYSITVETEDGTVGVLEGFRDCRSPELSVDLGEECAEGGVEIVISNTGDDDAVVEIDGEEVEVPAGEDVSVVVPVEENEDYSITVTIDDEPIATFEGTRNCQVDFLELGATGDCIDNVARISWSVGVDLATDDQTLTIRWYDLEGNLQLTQSGLPLTGSTTWPGIVVEDGEAVDWPGWFQDEDGEWVQGDDGFEWARPTVRITFEVNPTSDPIEVDYPPAQPGCTDPPETPRPPTVVGGVQHPRPAPTQPLPRTGGDPTRPIVIGLSLLISGAGVVLLATDRRRAAVR